MASIQELKDRIDLHDLADKLGWIRPHDNGNYKSPHRKDNNPSVSISACGKLFKDHTAGIGGSCIDMVIYHYELADEDIGEAVKILHDLYNIPLTPKQGKPAGKKTRAEYIAELCFNDSNPDHVKPAIEYLVNERNIPREIVEKAVKYRAVGFNDYRSQKVEQGIPGHGGPAVAFIARSLNPGRITGVDMRYIDPALNGGDKTRFQGEKTSPWLMNPKALARAQTVYLVESSMNALTVEACKMPKTIACAVLGAGNVDNLDYRFLQNKRVIVCFDNDKPDEKTGYPPGAAASWKLYDALVALNISAHFIDQADWEEEGYNDANDILQKSDIQHTTIMLKRINPYVLPGVRGDDKQVGRSRIFLPSHDYSQYWRYRTKEDFINFIKKRGQDADGQDKDEFEDLCGFRVAAISRVTISSATATMTGEKDNQPKTLFSVSVQAPRHGNQLLRRVFEDERLHNVDQWEKFGPVFNKGAFRRMISIMERGAHLGERNAVNFVGLAWRDGKVIVNEGPDCYFNDPDKQCPYHNLIFNTGSKYDARKVIEEYQKTFRKNAASMLLVWALGGHLKTLIGFWPHITLQSDKGAGKSTLIKRLERSIGFTMFSGQSLQTEFRLLTSISHTSHPVGWEEISARRQDVIDKAVSLLQESYQYSVSRRGSDMIEYLISAPVLLAGEDVPVKSLSGKILRTDLTGKKGPMMSEDLPRFPVREWLNFLAAYDRRTVLNIFERARSYTEEHSRSSGHDEGAKRMVYNYAALLTAWSLLCEFAEIDKNTGDFIPSAIEEMNNHISDSSQDREPWVWITEILFSEIESHNFKHPYTFAVLTDEIGEQKQCLIVRPGHVMDHLSHTSALRDKWNMLPVKTPRVYKRQLVQASVVHSDDVERTIKGRRYGHMTALDLDALARFGLHLSIPDASSGGDEWQPHLNV